MKEYRQVPVAVELVGDRKAKVRASLKTEGHGPQQPPVEQPQPRCGRNAAMVRRRSWINIAVCPCLHSSLTYHRILNPFENKVWEIYFSKEVCWFDHRIHKSVLWLWLYNRYLDLYLSQGYSYYVKCKQLHPGFKLR